MRPILDNDWKSQEATTLCVQNTSRLRPEGFEPPTYGSEDRCSIQLSYGSPFPAVRMEKWYTHYRERTATGASNSTTSLKCLALFGKEDVRRE